MIAIHDLTHVLAVLNAATIVVLIYAYSRIRAKDREGHRRAMMVAIAIGAVFLAVYLVYHASAGLAKFGGEGLIRPIYFTLLAIHVVMAFVVAVLVPITLYNALKGRFAVHRRFARVTYPSWMFVAVSGLVVYVMAVHLYPLPGAEPMSAGPPFAVGPVAFAPDRARPGRSARELGGWAWIAVGALAVAGVFALLLALSRVPGMDKAPLWPIGFFYKGLVIHVVFSLVIWLLGVFAFLATVATREVAGEAPRAWALGRIGQGVVLVAFPCLFAPAFLDQAQPELTNYVPLFAIRPTMSASCCWRSGCSRLSSACSSICPAGGRLPTLAVSMALAGFVFVLALVSFAVAGVLLARQDRLLTDREALFWGGGHLLQFVYAILLRHQLADFGAPQPRGGGGRRPHHPPRRLDHRPLRHPRADLLPDVRSLLRKAARRLPPAAVRSGAADAFVRGCADRERPRHTDRAALALARPRLLHPRRVAGAVCARRRDGFPDLRLGHPDAGALSRGRHRGQRVERRDAAHLRPRRARPAAVSRRAPFAG